jgi:hypothetical protein
VALIVLVSALAVAVLVALVLMLIVGRLVLQLQCREGVMEEGGERASVLVIIALVLDNPFVWFCFDSLRQISVLVKWHVHRQKSGVK